MNPRCSTTAVEDSAPQIVGSFSPVDELAAPVYQDQLVAEETTQNTTENPIPSSTSTSSDRLDELANMLDSCNEQLTPLAALGESIEKKTERIAMFTNRMMKRRRRTRYISLPGIMENATYLAASAWPHAARLTLSVRWTAGSQGRDTNTGQDREV